MPWFIWLACGFRSSALPHSPCEGTIVVMCHKIRLARVSDRAAVERIVRAAYSRYVPLMGKEPGPMLDDYAALIGKRRVHVAEREDEVRGILVLIPEKDAMLLDNIAVAPEAQGLGLGRKMLEFAEQEAATAGYRTVRLYTNEAMVENIALYLHMGFTEIHRGEENGFRRVYMSKKVARQPR
jgi:GNAT superfamily N-acetyltransferase